MHHTHRRALEQPATPPEPTAAEIIKSGTLEASRRMCRQSHIDRLRHCLAHGLSVRVGNLTGRVDAFLVAACDYRSTEEAASKLAQRAAAFGRDPSDVGRAYAELLEMQLAHTADEMMQAEGRGEAVEYGVEATSAATHTPGTWSTGESRFGAVVSDQPLPGYPGHGGHDDVKHYGGYLIAESIYRPEDARLISAAPDLLLACQGLLESAETGVTSLGVIRAAHAAIAKATGSQK